jgi:3-(3-hydroxy-phenyl)propionate hydroxylase
MHHAHNNTILQDRPLPDAALLKADVAIIGAGPVGLMIANLLGLQGVSVILIEKLATIIDYPRAIGLDDEALRVFQAVGLAEELTPHTTPDHWMRFTLRGRCFASIEPRTDEFGWPRRNAFHQPLADGILYRGLERFPCVRVLLGHSVERFTQGETGVTIEIADQDGNRRTVAAQYMVGADGGNSLVRRTLEVAFEGRTKANQWIVVDVRNDPIGSPHIYLHCDARRPFVSAALPHGIRRFEFMVMPGETEEELSKPHRLAELMRNVVAEPDQVDYIRKRVYTHNARLANRRPNWAMPSACARTRPSATPPPPAISPSPAPRSWPSSTAPAPPAKFPKPKPTTTSAAACCANARSKPQLMPQRPALSRYNRLP